MIMEDFKVKKKRRKFARQNSKLGLGIQQKAQKKRHAMTSIIQQAEEIRTKLGEEHPSFIKPLVKSHVSGSYWMALSMPFAKKHLPQENTVFTLENENGKTYTSHYLTRKMALSGGWKAFAIGENLLEGDVLIFELVSPARFKVHVVRQNDLSDIDIPLVMLNLGSRSIQCDPDEVSVGSVERCTQTTPVSCPATFIQPRDEEMTFPEDDQRKMPKMMISGNNSSVVSSGNSVNFEFPSNIEDFMILIDDTLKKDHELPHHIKWIYFQLCCSQNVLLHAHLPKGLNPMLIAGIIVQTVNLAEAMRNCELSTFDDEFSMWDENLSALEHLGMNVGFLRAHLNRLQTVAYDPKVAMHRQQCTDLCGEQAEAEMQIKVLEVRLSELKRASEKRATEIEKLRLEMENHELRFQEQVSAPW